MTANPAHKSSPYLKDRRMSAVRKLPLEFTDRDADQRGPVVTLLTPDLSPAYLEDAEPSPLMESLSRGWNRLIRITRWGLVLLLIAAYPASVISAHKINTDPVPALQLAQTPDPQTATMISLIQRELGDKGWAPDRQFWHPQARLTALPAWQQSLAEALSEYSLLRADHAGPSASLADPDLKAAARLLAPEQNVPATPRLHAAIEALQTYEGRVSRQMASRPVSAETYQAELALYAEWLQDSQSILRLSALETGQWPASSHDIRVVYAARAKAHVMSSLLAASPGPLFMASAEADTHKRAYEHLQITLRRIAGFSPLFITRQTDKQTMLADHPAMLAFHIQEARLALDTYMSGLGSATEPAISLAEAQIRP